MTWLSTHATEVTALGSIIMNVATLTIIIFNLNQFKLNSRSLNIDVNFKVFELRKNIYRETEDMIEYLKEFGNFLFLIKTDSGNMKINDKFEHFRESLENSKYLFSKKLFLDLESLVFLFDTGVSLEIDIQKIKEENPDNWTVETTQRIQDLTSRKKEVLDRIIDFDINQFVLYLNISNFHKDFIVENESKTYSIIISKIKDSMGKFKQTLLVNKKERTDIVKERQSISTTSSPIDLRPK